MPRVAAQKMDYSYSYTTVVANPIRKTGVTGLGNLVSDFTVGGWFKLSNDANSGFPALFLLFGQLQFFYAEGGKNIGINGNIGGTSYNTSYGGTQITMHGQWVHVSIDYDGASVSLYINGALKNSIAASGNVLNTALNIVVGGTTSGINVFTGKIKQAFVGPHLTPSQIKNIYYSGTFPSNMVIIYQLDEGTGSTATDSSGNGNHGTITSGTWTTDTPSKARTASSGRISVQDVKASIFNVLGGVVVPSNASTNVIGDSTHRTYSWGCRVKLSSKNAAATVLWAKASSKYSCQFRVEADGKIRAAIYDGSASIIAQSSNTRADGRWHSLIGVRDNNTLSLYIDGALVQTVNGTIGDTNEVSNIVMNGNNTIGSMSDTWFTFNALSAQDVLGYHLTSQIAYPCLFRLPLQEGAGTIAYDSSGNGNNGTITSGTWSADVPSKKRGVVGGNMIYNGDFSFVPMVNVPQTSGYTWLDGTSSGSGSNSLFGMAMFNYTSSYAAKFDITEKYNGNASLKLSTTGVASTVGVGTNLGDAGSHAKNNIPCSPNTSYTITFYMKTNLVSGSASSGALARLGMFQGNGTSSAGASTTIGLITTTTGWTKYTGTIVTSATARFLKTDFSVIGNDGAGTLIMDAWFADIQLRPTIPTTRGVS